MKKAKSVVLDVSNNISSQFIQSLSHERHEPSWMLQLRLQAFAAYERMGGLPSWLYAVVGDDFNPLHAPTSTVPSEIAPASLCAFGQCETQPDDCPAAGILMHNDSDTAYARLQQEWAAHGVIFIDMASALVNHPDLVQHYMGSVVAYDETPFTALTAALWRVGSFIFVPKGVNVVMPLQAYYRIVAEQGGQFERTLIIAQDESSLCYLEGCGSMQSVATSAHFGLVEVIAGPRSCVRFITLQQWGDSVVSCATKRAVAHEKAKIIWIDGTFGGKATYKYPTIMLAGQGACGQIIGSTMANSGQHHDTGGGIICQAPDARGLIVMKALGMPQGHVISRPKVRVDVGAYRAQVRVECDALLVHDSVDMQAKPVIDVREKTAQVAHEAQIATFEQEQLFYCQSRGINPESAQSLMALGFLDTFVQELPAEYAVEVARMLMPAMKGVHCR